jgi:hypothetical protein
LGPGTPGTQLTSRSSARERSPKCHWPGYPLSLDTAPSRGRAGHGLAPSRVEAAAVQSSRSISSMKILVRAATALGRSARKHRNRFGTEITHCRTGTGGMTRSTRCAAVRGNLAEPRCEETKDGQPELVGDSACSSMANPGTRSTASCLAQSEWGLGPSTLKEARRFSEAGFSPRIVPEKLQPVSSPEGAKKAGLAPGLFRQSIHLESSSLGSIRPPVATRVRSPRRRSRRCESARSRRGS